LYGKTPVVHKNDIDQSINENVNPFAFRGTYMYMLKKP